MKNLFGGFFVVLALLLFTTGVSAQQNNNIQKFALVIGNGNYTGITKLNNPPNDADDMASVLSDLGFTVDKVLNGTLDQMETAVTRLKNRLSVSKDSYGFLFYAGHGVQSNGENYLIPVDANIPSESYLRQRAVSVQTMLDEINEAGNELNIVVLDACRDNPFSWKRGGARGLTILSDQPADSIIVYATSAGSTAADGEGRNGLFTSFLLNNLKKTDMEVSEVFRLTMGDVLRASGNMQRPAVYNQYPGIAYLGSAPADEATAPKPAPLPPPATSARTVAGTPEKEKPSDTSAKLWTIGASVGSSLAAPWVIVMAHGTVAPLKYSFLEAGFDAGFISGASGVGYYSFYPFIHAAFFMPFAYFTGSQSTGGGFYVGAGAGYMMSKYNFPEGDLPMQSTIAMDAIAGVNLFDMIDISYTFRTNFSNMNNKIMVGYVYRFK